MSYFSLPGFRPPKMFAGVKFTFAQNNARCDSCTVFLFYQMGSTHGNQAQFHALETAIDLFYFVVGVVEYIIGLGNILFSREAGLVHQLSSNSSVFVQVGSWHQRIKGGWIPAPPCPQDFSKSCSFQAILSEKPYFEQIVGSRLQLRWVAADQNPGSAPTWIRPTLFSFPSTGVILVVFTLPQHAGNKASQ